MRLQRERARVVEKRGPIKHVSEEAQEEDTPEGETINIILGSDAVETTKMRSLDLSKAFDEDFAAIHSALRPSTDVLPESLSSTISSAVSTDIFSSKIGSSSTHLKGKKKLLDPTAILGGEGVTVLQAQKSVSSLGASDEPEEKPKKKVVRKVVKKVVKKKAPTAEEPEEPVEPIAEPVEPEEDFMGDVEEKPKKKVVRKVVKKVVKKKAPEPAPEEDLLGEFDDEKPKEPEPEENLLDGFGDEPEEKPK